MKSKKLNLWTKKTTSFSSQNFFEDTTNSSHQSNSSKPENKLEKSDSFSESSLEDILDNFNFSTINKFLQNTLSQKNLLPDTNEQKKGNNIFNEDYDTKIHFKFSIKNFDGIKHSKASFSNMINKNNEEKFFTENIQKINNEGKVFVEKQEMYKNSVTGEKKNEISKKYDDKEIKVIYKKNIFTGDTETHNILKNVKEEEIANFHKNFDHGHFDVDKIECPKKTIPKIPSNMNKLKVGKRKYFHKRVLPVNSMKVLGLTKSQIQ